jgi:hypothetical protein
MNQYTDVFELFEQRLPKEEPTTITGVMRVLTHVAYFEYDRDVNPDKNQYQLTLGELSNVSKKELTKHRKIRKEFVNKIEEIMQEYGFSFKP